MAYIDITATKNSDIYLPVALPESPSIPLFIHFNMNFNGRGTDALGDAASGFTVYWSYVEDDQGNSSLFINNDPSTQSWVYNGFFANNNNIFYRRFYDVGSSSWKIQVGIINQTALSGNDYDAPNIITNDITPNISDFHTMILPYEGSGSSLGGTSSAQMFFSIDDQIAYVMEITEEDAILYNGYELNDGETQDTFIDDRLFTFQDSYYYYLYRHGVTGELIIVKFQKQPYGSGFNYQKYRITFDEPFLNTAILNENFYADAVSDGGFFIQFYGDGFGDWRNIFISLDGLSYDEIIITGDSLVETHISNYSLTVSKLNDTYKVISWNSDYTATYELFTGPIPTYPTIGQIMLFPSL